MAGFLTDWYLMVFFIHGYLDIFLCSTICTDHTEHLPGLCVSVSRRMNHLPAKYGDSSIKQSFIWPIQWNLFIYRGCLLFWRTFFCETVCFWKLMHEHSMSKNKHMFTYRFVFCIWFSHVTRASYLIGNTKLKWQHLIARTDFRDVAKTKIVSVVTADSVSVWKLLSWRAD